MIQCRASACSMAIMLFVLISQIVEAQIVTAPLGLSYNIYRSIPESRVHPMDTSLFARQRHISSKITSETVAYNFRTNFVPFTDGILKTIIPGVNSWFLKLKSIGAHGLALVFSGIKLMPGEILYVYNQNGLRGPYTYNTVPSSGILPLDFLKGDEVMIEYDMPAANINHGTFVVETISHAYRNIFNHETHHFSQSQEARTSNDCYMCLENDAIDKERRAVVKLVVQYDSTVKICTGTLVNNTARDNKPYILTAEHCVSNQFDADRTVLVFGFEDENCVKKNDHNYLTLTGAFHRASLVENDFSILELYDRPPLEFRPYYAGWDISDQYLSGVTCVHHPQGGPKKVSVSNGMVSTSNFDDGISRMSNAFWKVSRWDVGVTEGGSSGASLFNKDNNIIGTLSGGSSECGTPFNDYFSKLSTSWEASSDPDHQLKYWLDPGASGVQKLDGTDPFEGINATCHTISNIKPGEQQNLLSYPTGKGYFSGYNSDSIASYAEKFSTADSVMLTGVTLNIGSVNVNSLGGIMVSVHSSKNGIPGPVLSNSYIPYYNLAEDSLNYIEFYPYVKLGDDFFISYTLSYSPDDIFALKQVDWRSNSNNTAYAKLSSGWTPISVISPNGKGSSFGIKITTCENSLVESPSEKTFINFHPNPATTVLIGRLPDAVPEKFNLVVYDLQGRQQTVLHNFYENYIVITTADLSPGMYIVKFSTLHGVYQSKFIKR